MIFSAHGLQARGSGCPLRARLFDPKGEQLDQEEEMGFIKHEKEERESIGKRRERYLGHTDKLMMVVIDFSDGPTSEPDPPHS
ncbi:MAG: hypothetical protein ACR2PH_07610, partial [Desulfobulbia bacterium]